jgi:hypothetical protein
VEESISQFPTVGYKVFWRLAGIRVSHPEQERALQIAGIDKYLHDPPTPRATLRRALAEWINARQRIIEPEFAHVYLRTTRLEHRATRMEHVAYFCLLCISLISTG